MTVHSAHHANDGSDSPTAAFLADTSGTGGSTAAEPFGARTGSDGDRPAEQLHGGIDFGLFVLRISLGGLMIAHGLQKFGLFDGPGTDGFAQALTSMGFTGPTTLLAWVTALAEVGGGALLVLGFFTPLGAAAVLGVMANAVYGKLDSGFFAATGGFEFDLLIAFTAFALLFTGAGRIAIDKNTPWRRRPWPFGLAALVLAAATSAAAILLFR